MSCSLTCNPVSRIVFSCAQHRPPRAFECVFLWNERVGESEASAGPYSFPNGTVSLWGNVGIHLPEKLLAYVRDAIERCAESFLPCCRAGLSLAPPSPCLPLSLTPSIPPSLSLTQPRRSISRRNRAALHGRCSLIPAPVLELAMPPSDHRAASSWRVCVTLSRLWRHPCIVLFADCHILVFRKALICFEFGGVSASYRGQGWRLTGTPGCAANQVRFLLAHLH